MDARDEVRLPYHGGDLHAIAARYGVDASKLLDFSANINPSGPPQSVLDAVVRVVAQPSALGPYPDATAQPLRALLARHHNVDEQCIVVANGAAAILDAAIRVLARSACVVPVPAFSEYRRAIDAARVRFAPFPLDGRFDFESDALMRFAVLDHAELVVLTNPHNPSGAVRDRARMEQLIAACEARAVNLIVDEAFIDYVPGSSVIARAVTTERVVVARSLTKFYGMAGIRIGYAVAHAATAHAIRAALPSWPVGALEIAAASAALHDHEYAVNTLRMNGEQRKRLRDDLLRRGITVLPSAANFLLCELPVAWDALDGVLEYLVRRCGIVVRDCRTYDGLHQKSMIRVAVRDRNENARLADALTGALESSQTG